MQTIKRTTGLRTAATDYVTLVQQAINKVTGFGQLYKELERAINVTGKSPSTLANYSRHLAHLALHYDQLPTLLDQEQVLDYLHFVKSKGSPSATFFKFTVYGMRYACKLRGLPYQQFSLPAIDRNDKLPVVLNSSEVKALLKACDLLKHRLLIGLCYGCGLRCAEVRNLSIADVDTERGMLHVRQGKGSKDRCLPMGTMLSRGIREYITAEKPRKYLFEGKDGTAYSQRGTQWAVSQAVKKAAVFIKAQLPASAPLITIRPDGTNYNPLQCPCCKKDTMHTLMQFNQRGPPQRCMEAAADVLYAII
jgi:integrase/recombinase XerD